VTIEKMGSIRVQGTGGVENIRMLVSNAEAFLSGFSVFDDMNDPCPYELVSFDENNEQIVVRKKTSSVAW
jgi:hypothetical protein